MPASHPIPPATVDTLGLPPEAQEALAESLLDVHREIFTGVDRAGFLDNVIAPRADQNLVSVQRDPQGRAVGYCTLQRRDLELPSGRVRILRGVMGFVPEHRGKSLGARFYAWNVVKHTLGAWAQGRRCYMLGTPVGPFMYVALARAMDEFWPHPERATPGPEQRLMTELAEVYRFQAAQSGAAGCCQVGWVLRQSAEERRAMHAKATPELRFFVERNPAYDQGDGLIMLVPFHPRNLLSGLLRALRTRARRRSPSPHSPQARTSR